MGKINVLPPDLVNQIAAGEVVERPASVVKELVENALDAGTSRIEVHASNGGRNLRIADDGCGMDADDLQTAFQNHATSKIHVAEDLFKLVTLGFRGEALASIAAIANVTCISRPTDANTGLKATVDHSGHVTLQETGCAPGSIFEITNLFYNVPARLKFLKQPKTELAHIQETLQMLALSHPTVCFTLKIEDAQALKTSGSGDLETTAREVFSIQSHEQFVPFNFEDPDLQFKAWGITSAPSVMRGSKKWLMTYVNGRGIKCPILQKAIERAYESMITPGKYPITLLFLELPPEEVDVNVHPTKREVKYSQANTLFSFVRHAIETGLADSKLDYASTPAPTSPTPSTTIATPKGGSSSHWQANKSFGSPATTTSFKPPTASHTQAALDFHATPDTTPSSEAMPDPWLPQPSNWTVLGQLWKTYILVETQTGLLMVDQHIAIERVMFEKLSAQAEQTEPASRTLLLSMEFPVSPNQRTLLDTHRSLFESLGFGYALTADTVSFESIPAMIDDTMAQHTLQQLIVDIEETGTVHYSIDDAIATAACHSSIRAGDALSHEQMTAVMSEWFDCKRPWTCPHGRPVSHEISKKEMMALFDRPSLPV